MRKTSISRLRQIGKQQKIAKDVPLDPLIAAEEQEIQRLERLLGITKSKDKKSVVSKLNKEYEEEGIGADFGTFLMDLDNIIGMGGSSSRGDDVDDIMMDYPSEDEKLSEKKSKKQRKDNRINDQEDLDEDIEMPRKKKTKLIDEPGQTVCAAVSQEAYVPPSKRLLKGGISSTSTKGTASNVPNLETKQEKAIKKLRRAINGIVNKLSDDTKDRILQDLNELYELNNAQLVTNLLLDCVFNHVLANQLKFSFQLPLFTTFLTAVHALIGESMAKATVHKVFDQFLNILEQGKDLDWNKQSHNALLVVVYLTMLNVLDLSLVVDLVQYFLHPVEFCASVPAKFQDHRFFRILNTLPEMLRMEYVDMILCRVGDRIRREDPATLQSFVTFFQQKLRTTKAAANGTYTRMQFLYESLADFDCKRVQRVRDKHFEEIKECRKWLSGHVQRQYRSMIMQRQQEDERRRSQHESSKSSDNDEEEYVVPRSILAFVAGSNVYASHNERLFSSANIVIPDNNVDLATASAILHESAARNSSDQEDETDDRKQKKSSKQASAAVVVEQIVAKKGQQLRLNTPNRKAIFGVLMTCRDLEDAYEKIVGLHLGPTMDRDLVRVLLECAGKEWPYNPFYGELLKLFCTTMPACKLTAEIAYYDEITTIIAQDEESQEENDKMRVKTERRVMNLARMLADLLMQFKITLAVLRKIDISLIGAGSSHALLLLFLSTLFLNMFTYESEKQEMENMNNVKHSNDEDRREALLLSVCDRLGRSKHYEVVRMLVLQFLEEHMKKLPSSIPKDSPLALRVKKGRKVMLKSMRDMEILHQYTTAETAMGSTSNDKASDFGSAEDFDRIGDGKKKGKKGKKTGSGWDAAIDFD